MTIHFNSTVTNGQQTAHVKVSHSATMTDSIELRMDGSEVQRIHFIQIIRYLFTHLNCMRLSIQPFQFTTRGFCLWFELVLHNYHNVVHLMAMVSYRP